MHLNTNIVTNEDSSGLYLTFCLNDESFAIAVSNVIEIVGIQDFTQVPDTPDYMKGVLNVRGRNINIIDARIRLGLPAAEYDSHACVIVVEYENRISGILVDCLSEVLNIPDESIQEAPAYQRNAYIEGISIYADKVHIMLDVASIIEISI